MRITNEMITIHPKGREGLVIILAFLFENDNRGSKYRNILQLELIPTGELEWRNDTKSEVVIYRGLRVKIMGALFMERSEKVYPDGSLKT